jgi:exonuclease III
MGLTETWVIDDNVNNFGLEGFKYIGVNRSNKKVCGVGIYVNEKVKHKLRNDININLENLIESIFIEIITSTGKNVIVGVIYRPPNQKFETFEKAVDEIVNKIDKENKVCYLMGDFSIDLLKSESCDYSNRFAEQHYSSHFHFLHLLQNQSELLHIQPHLLIIFLRTILKNLTQV